MKKNKKGQISEKVAVRAIINGFISYGILIGFIFGIIGILLNYCTSQLSFSNELLFRALTTLLLSIFIYFFLHLICKISTIDFLRKCKINKEKENFICKRLNLFYLICIIFFVLLTITSMLIDFSNQLNEINFYYNQTLNNFNDRNLATDYANVYKKEALEDFNNNKKETLLVSIILELGIVYSFISLIPYQKKMLYIYNKS